jgi:DNA helicase-2/ATP-dependent DNA helicase PcrA
MMERVLKESGLEAMYVKLDKDREDQVANLSELITSAAEYDAERPDGTLGEYLTQVSLVSDADHLAGAGGSVTLMTLHAAKGLEFPVVVMVGLEEGILPHARSRDSSDEMEEERRLAFVGITRAQERLFMTSARYRTIRGLRERTVVSPFIRELPEDQLSMIDRSDADFAGPFGDRASGGSSAASDDPFDGSSSGGGGFKRGQLWKHPQFGIGRVLEVSQIGSSTRLIIDFQRAGRKTLFAEFARLERV